MSRCSVTSSAFAVLCGFSLAHARRHPWLDPLLRPVMFALFRAEGEVAADNLQSALSRSAVAAASLMTGVAMVVSVAIMIASFKRTVYTWVDQTVQADLIVSAADPSSGVSTVPLPTPWLASCAASKVCWRLMPCAHGRFPIRIGR